MELTFASPPAKCLKPYRLHAATCGTGHTVTIARVWPCQQHMGPRTCRPAVRRSLVMMPVTHQRILSQLGSTGVTRSRKITAFLPATS